MSESVKTVISFALPLNYWCFVFLHIADSSTWLRWSQSLQSKSNANKTTWMSIKWRWHSRFNKELQAKKENPRVIFTAFKSTIVFPFLNLCGLFDIKILCFVIVRFKDRWYLYFLKRLIYLNLFTFYIDVATTYFLNWLKNVILELISCKLTWYCNY